MPKNDCKICGGEGWIYVTDPSGVESVRPCKCVITSQSEELLYGSGIPSRYQECTLDNYSEALIAFTSRQKKVLEVCNSFVQQYPDVKKGLLLAGKEGVGKTHLGIGILKGIAEKGYSVYFLDIQELFNELRKYYREGYDLKANKLLQKVLNIDLLQIDDFGVYDPNSNWVQDTMFYLINQRFNNIKHIIVTTNFLDRVKGRQISLEERIGLRLRSRLYEMCDYYEIDGEDHRKVKAFDGKIE